jgi:hypothetical protein
VNTFLFLAFYFTAFTTQHLCCQHFFLTFTFIFTASAPVFSIPQIPSCSHQHLHLRTVLFMYLPPCCSTLVFVPNTISTTKHLSNSTLYIPVPACWLYSPVTLSAHYSAYPVYMLNLTGHTFAFITLSISPLQPTYALFAPVGILFTAHTCCTPLH